MHMWQLTEAVLAAHLRDVDVHVVMKSFKQFSITSQVQQFLDAVRVVLRS